MRIREEACVCGADARVGEHPPSLMQPPQSLTVPCSILSRRRMVLRTVATTTQNAKDEMAAKASANGWMAMARAVYKKNGHLVVNRNILRDCRDRGLFENPEYVLQHTEREEEDRHKEARVA